MAPGPMPPAPYGALYPRSPPTRWLPFVIVIVFALLFIVFYATVMVNGFSGVFGLSTVFFAPFCIFFVFLIIVVVLAVSQGMYRPQIPPPPPIQQPMVPAGTQGPVALSCPNCGAPPTVVDRFGVATCPYCNTRFLVH